MAKVPQSGHVLRGRGARSRWRFVVLRGNCPGVAGAVLELYEVALSKPQLNIPSLGMLLCGGLHVGFGGVRERRTELGILVSPLVTNAIALGYDASGYHGVGCVRSNDFYYVEANLLTENKTPAIVPEVAII